MGIEAIAIGIFLFIALSVAGCRALDTVSHKAAKRSREVTSYTGPLYNQHGRETE